MSFIKKIIGKVNFLNKDFFVKILPEIELPNIFNVFLFALILFMPVSLIFNHLFNDSEHIDLNESYHRMNICLSVVSSKTSEKCVQGQYIDNQIGQVIKFVAYERKGLNENLEIQSSYLLTDNVKSEIEKLYKEADKFHIVSMLQDEVCPEDQGKTKARKCKGFVGYKVIESAVDTYVVMYDKHSVDKYAKEVSNYLSSVF